MHETGFDHFDRVSRVCQTTRDILVRRLAGKSDGSSMAFLSAESLSYVERAEHGMRLLSRAPGFNVAETANLVRRAGISEPPWPGSPDGVAAFIELETMRRLAPKEIRRVDLDELEAFGHAQVVIAMIPHSPLVSWPVGPTTYGDVLAPRTAGELALRMEELERVLWLVAQGRIWRGDDLRRTYAFFETATSLQIGGFGTFGGPID